MEKRKPEIVEIVEPVIQKVVEFWFGLKENHPGYRSVDPYVTNLVYQAAEEIYQLGWEDGHRHNWEE